MGVVADATDCLASLFQHNRPCRVIVEISLDNLPTSSSDLCAGHPARGPTSGSEAYLKSASASDSCQWRSKILSVSIRLYQCFAVYLRSLSTMCTYPSQSVKISIHSCTFSKNFPIRRLMPFQYIPFFLMLIYLVIYFVINSCANTPSAQSVSAEWQEYRI